jgi:hypothetical protein
VSYKKVKFIALAFLLMVAALVGMNFIFGVKQLTLGMNPSVRFSDVLENWAESQKVCILAPYSIRMGPAQEKSLAIVFGDVNYDLWKERIIYRHTKGYHWSLYLVSENNIVFDFLPIKRNTNHSIEFGEGLGSGCFDASKICAYSTFYAESKNMITIKKCSSALNGEE